MSGGRTLGFLWRRRLNNKESEPIMTTSQSTYSHQESAAKVSFSSSGQRKSISDFTMLPEEWQEYKVQPGDTVQGVAVKFATTPSDLGQLNHWFGSTHQRQLYPGSVIRVPCTPRSGVAVSGCSGEPHFSPTRPAPGLASRLTTEDKKRISSQKEFCHAPEYDEAMRASPHTFLSSDDEEKGFVRVAGERVLMKPLQEGDEKHRNYDLVAGTVIVTPDFFIFEPETERQSGHDDQPPISVPPPAAVCQSLASIESMYTRSKVDQAWAPLLHISNTDPTLSSTSSSDMSPHSNEIPQPLVSSTENVPEEHVESTEPSLPEDTAQEITSFSSPTPTKSATPLASNETDPLKGKLLLCLQPSPSSENEHSNTAPQAILMIFAIWEYEIDEVFAFMLHCGVGQSAQGGHNRRRHNTSGPDNSWDVVERFHTAPESLASPRASDCDEDFVELGGNNVNNQQVLSPDSVASELRRLEEETYRPLLKNGESEILTDSMLDDLSTSLPSHLYGTNMSLVFKTSRDGFSLQSIYRKMRCVNSAVLLIILDTENTVFGAVLNERMQTSQYFYGKGETYVFHWRPTFKTYKWSGANAFFMKGDNNYFSVGAKSGHNAIWFEDNLKNGRSEPTDTFNNPVLCGGTSSAFTIHSLELWTFVS